MKLVGEIVSKTGRITYAAGKADPPVRTDSVDSLERHTSAVVDHIEVLRQPAGVGTVQEPGLRADNRSVVVEDHRPCAAASCLVGHTVLGYLEVGRALGRSSQLLGVRAPLLACAHSLLPSSSPSTLCESL